MNTTHRAYRTLRNHSCFWMVLAALTAACASDESKTGSMGGSGADASADVSNSSQDTESEYVPLPEALQEIDCSDVSTPELIATFDDFPNIGFLAQGNLMLVHDGFLYLAGLRQLYRLDLSDPAAPEMIYDRAAKALVLHNDQVHFADGDVYRIAETGAEPEMLDLAGDRLLSDGTSLFAWTDKTFLGCDSQLERDRTLRRMDADGTVTELNEQPICAFGGSLGDGFLYFTGIVLDSDEVHTFRVSTEGGEVQQLELETDEWPAVIWSEGYLYGWEYPLGSGELQRGTPSDLLPTIISDSASHPHPGPDGKILFQESNLTGACIAEVAGDGEAVVLGGAEYTDPEAITADAEYVYFWTREGDNTSSVYRAQRQ